MVEADRSKISGREKVEQCFAIGTAGCHGAEEVREADLRERCISRKGVRALCRMMLRLYMLANGRRLTITSDVDQIRFGRRRDSVRRRFQRIVTEC
jgi:hypothetical protein